ncbi:MAG TPA: cytochrome c [Gammaproteobacteria bacterium]
MERSRRAYMASVVLAAMVTLAACQESTSSAAAYPVKMARPSNAAQVARGQVLFMQHCARCHGERAQGDTQWRRRNPDGTFPPPPLDGSGHAWHHSHSWLKEMIRNGAPQGNMPAWGGSLDEQQIEDLIAWFQSLWPDEVYAAWWAMEQRSQGQ